ncbi:hypothetical protein [Cellulosimicrobium composti]|uniref:Uncharacterized protein n=1 Tax=Cellulosimicrobium composti TaxID=2672572 RepID=A0ABX0BC64_9MICO|nr:hypothetical protein [Cellulosimicrobium composti]NDO90129.1 hypothetical protein [Cellulosimicrobium composti]
MADRSKAEVVLDLFGVNIEQQGRGFYVSLELLAIARGVYEEARWELLDPGVDVVSYRRSSHDFARRVAAGAAIDPDTLHAAVDDDEETLATLQALTSSLLVQVPGRRKSPSWYNSHLYPFVGELIHYDAVERRKAGLPRGTKVPHIERYVLRGGGGWAYRVLRTDPDGARRAGTREGLLQLVRDGETSLGEIARALRAHDEDTEDEAFPDKAEAEINAFGDLSPWPEYLRRGVNSIVSRTQVPRAKRIESLMHWTPYCLARHQLHLARTSLAMSSETVFVDMLKEASPLRRLSQDGLDGFRKNIVNAIIARATTLHSNAVASGNDELARRYVRHMTQSKGGTGSPVAFFSESLAAVGALNATTGRRHFTMKPPMLEAMVCASLAPGQEEELYAFCSRLFDDYRVIVDDRTAGEHDLTVDVDASILARNLDAFRSRLAATGLLTQYSDATSIVRGEPR